MGHPLAALFRFRSFFALVPKPPGALTNSQDKKDDDKAQLEEGDFFPVPGYSSEPRGKMRVGCQRPGRNGVDDRQGKTMLEQEPSASQAIPRHARFECDESEQKGVSDHGDDRGSNWTAPHRSKKEADRDEEGDEYKEECRVRVPFGGPRFRSLWRLQQISQTVVVVGHGVVGTDYKAIKTAIRKLFPDADLMAEPPGRSLLAKNRHYTNDRIGV